MEKYFKISKIQSAEDGGPYVYITLVSADSSEKDKTQTKSPFGNTFNMENLMNNLPKSFSDMFGGGGTGPINPNTFGANANSTTFKLSMREYQELGIKIGDRIKVGITKKESIGI